MACPSYRAASAGAELDCGILCCTSAEGQDAQVREGDDMVARDEEARGRRLEALRRPHDQGVLAFTAKLELPLRGSPVRTGKIWFLSGDTFERASLSVLPTGIRLERRGVRVLSVAWSPFCVVEACRFRTSEFADMAPFLRLFKVSLPTAQEVVFAVKGEDAEMERAHWVADIAGTIRRLTQTLFPPFNIDVFPLQGARWTSTRLMAGYLLQYHSEVVAALWFELHPHWNRRAALVAYENELCQVQVMQLNITEATTIYEQRGFDCSNFTIDGHRFTTRTAMEKQLWLRAVQNLKVKILHRAPNPAAADVASYRSAILERVARIQRPQDERRLDPMLPMCGRLTKDAGTTPRGPFMGVGAGGEPLDEEESAGEEVLDIVEAVETTRRTAHFGVVEASRSTAHIGSVPPDAEIGDAQSMALPDGGDGAAGPPAPTRGRPPARETATCRTASMDEADDDVPCEKAPNRDCGKPINCQPMFTESRSRFDGSAQQRPLHGVFRLPAELGSMITTAQTPCTSQEEGDVFRI